MDQIKGLEIIDWDSQDHNSPGAKHERKCVEM